MVERAVALSAGPTIDAKDIQLDTVHGRGAASSSAGDHFLPEGMTLEQWEDNMIREALRRANGNKSQAARLLGLSRNALRYRLGKLGVPDEAD
jgi:DNA-binding NtrC family response regulator